MQKCQRCGQDKPDDDFYKNGYVRKDGTQGLMLICKPCNRDKSREWYQANPERGREAQRQRAARRRERLGPEASRRYDRDLKIRRKYGITIADWDRMLAEQDGLCAICAETLTGKICVDHCHATGRVRGLLCPNCNVGIGYFADDPARLRAAATYVEQTV